MTDQDLDRLEALANNATDGPWTVGEHFHLITESDPAYPDELMGSFHRGARFLHRPDAAFVAASRTAVPALIAEVRRLTREHAELEQQFDTIANELDRRDKAPKMVSAHQVWVAAKSQADFNMDGTNVDAYIEPLIEGLQKAGITVDSEEFAAYVGKAPVPSWAEQQRIIERVREALAGHPQCDKYADDDPITCGWKSAVRSIQWALDGEDEQ